MTSPTPEPAFFDRMRRVALLVETLEGEVALITSQGEVSKFAVELRQVPSDEPLVGDPRVTFLPPVKRIDLIVDAHMERGEAGEICRLTWLDGWPDL